jgi:hypothetical protein
MAAVDEPAADRPGERLDLAYGAVIGALYVIAVAASVWVVMDEATHGEMSRTVAARCRAFAAKVADWRRIETTVRKEAPFVVFDAMEATRDAAENERP